VLNCILVLRHPDYNSISLNYTHTSQKLQKRRYRDIEALSHIMSLSSDTKTHALCIILNTALIVIYAWAEAAELCLIVSKILFKITRVM
jgi:hypothetical protein